MSRSLPNARSAKKLRDGQFVGRRVMERFVCSAYQQFMVEHPNTKISLSAFTSLRPKTISPSTRNRKRDCLCEYCANVDLKLEALRSFDIRKGIALGHYQDKFDVSRQTLCVKGENGESERKCQERKCDSCGVNKVEAQLRPLTEQYAPSHTVDG